MQLKGKNCIHKIQDLNYVYTRVVGLSLFWDRLTNIMIKEVLHSIKGAHMDHRLGFIGSQEIACKRSRP